MQDLLAILCGILVTFFVFCIILLYQVSKHLETERVVFEKVYGKSVKLNEPENSNL